MVGVSKPRRPGPPPSFYPPATPPAARPRWPPHPARPPGGPELRVPPDPVQQQIGPGQGVPHAEPPPGHIADPCQRPALILPALRSRSRLQNRFQLTQLRQRQLAPGAPAALDASAARPPAASARRHRFADIRDTRNCQATSQSLAPDSTKIRGCQPHLFPAGPLSCIQPATLVTPHNSAYRTPSRP